MALEIEAKFRIPDLATFQQLLNAESLAGFVLSLGRMLQVQDTYLDTAAQDLRAAGYACRLRVQGEDIRLALKSLAGGGGVVHQREEVEQSLSAISFTSADWLPGPVRDRLIELCGPAPLLPVATLRQSRFVRLLSEGERVVAESSLDRVQMVDADGRTEMALMCEVELVSGGQPDDLQRVVDYMCRNWALMPESRSKLEMALDFLQATILPFAAAECNLARDMRPAAPGILPDDPLPEAVRKLLRFYFQELLRHEPGTRSGANIESLHDMRVATRRMRAVLRVFGPYFETALLRPFVKALRKTGQVLGRVRDLDVFHEHLQPYLVTLSAAERVAAEPLLIAWTGEHTAARADLLAYLDSATYTRFTVDFSAHLDAPELWEASPFDVKGAPCPYRVRHIASLCLAAALVEILAYDEWVFGSQPSVERLHQLRIAGKRLRYTCEFLREVLDPQVEQIITDVKTLQDHLGALQDAVVAQELVLTFITEGHWGANPAALRAPHVAPGWGAYLAERLAEQDYLIAGFPEIWQHFQSRDFKRQVLELGAVR